MILLLRAPPGISATSRRVASARAGRWAWLAASSPPIGRRRRSLELFDIAVVMRLCLQRSGRRASEYIVLVVRRDAIRLVLLFSDRTFRLLLYTGLQADRPRTLASVLRRRRSQRQTRGAHHDTSTRRSTVRSKTVSAGSFSAPTFELELCRGDDLFPPRRAGRANVVDTSCFRRVVCDTAWLACERRTDAQKRRIVLINVSAILYRSTQPAAESRSI